MAGRAHMMITTIIDRRSKGDPVAAAGVRVRLLLRGIDPSEFGPTTDDDPAIITKLEQMMAESEMAGENSWA